MGYIQSTITCMCISLVPCVCEMHAHAFALHICVLTHTLVEHKDCRCICRHGMHIIGYIQSTKLTSTKLHIVEKNCRCICIHDIYTMGYIQSTQIHACVYHVCIDCVCVKCMHMHVHCICALPSLHGIVHNKHYCNL